MAKSARIVLPILNRKLDCACRNLTEDSCWRRTAVVLNADGFLCQNGPESLQQFMCCGGFTKARAATCYGGRENYRIPYRINIWPSESIWGGTFLWSDCQNVTTAKFGIGIHPLITLRLPTGKHYTTSVKVSRTFSTHSFHPNGPVWKHAYPLGTASNLNLCSY